MAFARTAPTRSAALFFAALLALTTSLAARADDFTLRDDRPAYPAISMGLGGGLAYWTETSPFGTDTSIGRGLAPGYALSVRASLELNSWFAIDLRGKYLRNDGNDLVHNGSLSTGGGLGGVRFTLPTQTIHPYILLGAGYYDISASGFGTDLVSGSFAAVEFGLGATVEAGRGMQVGVEYSYSHLLGETLSNNPDADGGDPSTVSIFVQYRFGL